MTTDYTEVFQDADGGREVRARRLRAGQLRLADQPAAAGVPARAGEAGVPRPPAGAARLRLRHRAGDPLLHGLVRAAHGYDTSAADAGQGARGRASYAELHQVAGDGPVPEPVDAGAPALVTMFRLLLNVDDVRDRAIAFAAKVLPHGDSGLLVVENHGNRQLAAAPAAPPHAGALVRRAGPRSRSSSCWPGTASRSSSGAASPAARRARTAALAAAGGPPRGRPRRAACRLSGSPPTCCTWPRRIPQSRVQSQGAWPSEAVGLVVAVVVACLAGATAVTLSVCPRGRTGTPAVADPGRRPGPGRRRRSRRPRDRSRPARSRPRDRGPAWARGSSRTSSPNPAGSPRWTAWSSGSAGGWTSSTRTGRFDRELLHRLRPAVHRPRHDADAELGRRRHPVDHHGPLRRPDPRPGPASRRARQAGDAPLPVGDGPAEPARLHVVRARTTSRRGSTSGRSSREEGATNVSWVWCPTAEGFGSGDAPDFYPGDDQVDWLCVDVYAGSSRHDRRPDAAVPARSCARHPTNRSIIGEFGVARAWGRQRGPPGCATRPRRSRPTRRSRR